MAEGTNIGAIEGTVSLDDKVTVAFKKVASTLESEMKKVGQTMSAAGRSLSLGITAPIVAAAGASIGLSGSFEASMRRLVSLAGVSSGELNEVKQHILALAPAVGIGPLALADAMTKVSSTVSNTKVAMSILDIAAKGSAAGLGEAVDVAGALTAVINSYGAANITAARAGDILTKTVQDGGASAKELAPVLANVVPIAAQMGISFEEVGANIATLTKLGVPAAEAVTQLSSVMTAMLKETAKGKDALASVGLSYAELRAEIRERGLAAAMTDLTQRFKGNESGLTAVFGRIEALRNVMGTAGQQAATYADEVKRMGKTVDGSLGSLESAFLQMKGSQTQTWGEFKAQLQVVAITVGDSLVPAMKDALQAAKPVLQWALDAANAFKDLPSGMKTATIAFLALTAAIGPVLFMLGGITQGVSSVISLFKIATPAVTLLTTETTLLGVSMKVVTGLSIVGLFVSLAFAVREVINAMRELDKVISEGGSIWNFFTAKDDDTFARRWLRNLGILKQVAEAVPAGDINLPSSMAFSTPQVVDWSAARGPAGSPIDVAAMKEAAKAAETLAKRIRDTEIEIAQTTTQMRAMTPALEAQIKHWLDFGLTSDEVGRKLHLTGLAVRTVHDSFLRMATDLTSGTTPSLITLGTTTKGLIVPAMTAAEEIEALHRAGQHTAATMKSLGVATGQNILSLKDFGDASRRAGIEVEVSLGDRLKGVIKNSLGGLNDIFQRAFEGGGGVMGAVKSFATNMVSNLTGMIPVIGPIISQFSGAIVAGITKLFGGVSEAVKKARGELESFNTGLAKNATATQVAQAAGSSWKLTVIQVRDAYLATGRSAEAALKVTEALWDTDHPLRMKAAIDEVNGVLQEQKDMMDQQKQDAADLKDAIQRWGFSFEELGPALQRQQLSETALSLMNDFQLLVNAGVDYNVVLDKMGGAINEFVNKAIASGTEVPSAMKPILQHMIDQKELLDKNGKAFTTLEGTGLTFSETMTQGFDRVVKAIERALIKIGLMPAALDKVPKNFDIHGHVIIDNTEIVDTAPYTPSSGNPRTADSLNFRPAASSSSSASASATLEKPVILNVDGREFARVLIPLIPEELRKLGVI